MTFQVKNRFLGSLLLVSTIVFSGFSHARPPDDDEGLFWEIANRTDVAAIDYRGQLRTYEFPAGESVFTAVKAARDALYSGLRTQFEAGVAATVQGKDGYRWHQSWVNGPIQFGISPTPGSAHPTVSISQISAGFKVHTKNRKHLISVTCDLSVESGPMTVAGKLDVASGQIYDIRVQSIQPKYKRDCDSNVSWIPGIGSYIENYAEGKIDQAMEQMIGQVMAMSQSTFQPVRFAGLNVSIPDGRYVFDGFDVGQYVRNNLATLVTTATVTTRFDAPLPINLVGRPTHSGERHQVDRSVLGINFASQGISFALVERTYFQAAKY